MLITHPRLRHPIDIRQERIGNESLILLRCPIGISEEPLGLKPEVGPIIALFDGTKTTIQIADQLKSYGATEEIVRELANLLEQHFFLDTEKFHERSLYIKKRFFDLPARKTTLAGGAYNNDPEKLTEELSSYMKGEDSKTTGDIVGLVAPHIDYKRGSISYGKSYKNLKDQDHDTYILMGTAHQYSNHLFHLTEKDFETPLGALKTDTAFVKELANGYGIKRAYADELLHKQEHSLELQTPFMKLQKPNSLIVPILIGSFHNFLVAQKHPTEFEIYEALAENLTNIVKKRSESGQKICFIAGVDMAHVGRVFGDKQSLTEKFLFEIRERDEIYLKAILEQDKEKLYDHIAEDQDARRVCGYPTMYLLLDVLDRLKIQYKAELYDYRQAVDFNNDCAVTFAGIGLYA